MTEEHTEEHVDPYAHVQAALDALTDHERVVALVRLAMKLNNGKEHFDHSEVGYSWLCHRCAQEGKGGLNGWAGAFYVMGEAAKADPR